MEQAEIIKRKLRWKCRRGMLELDIILVDFFDQYYDALSQEDKQLFARVLDMDDTQLFACLMHAEKIQDAELMAMIDRISDSRGGQC